MAAHEQRLITTEILSELDHSLRLNCWEKNPSRLARSAACRGPPALSTQAREDHCTVVYTTQERKFILRHGGAYEFDLGRSCISCKPVRGDSASGHSLDTWCEVGRHLPSQYPKGTVRKTLKGDAIQKARDGDHCKWQRDTERKIKHWKKMLRRGRFMLQKGLRNEEHRGGTVLNKLILGDACNKSQYDSVTNGQRSMKWQQSGILNPRYFTQHCFKTVSDIEGKSECRPGTKFMSFSSISDKVGSRRGCLKRAPHVTRKTKHQNTEFLSKSGIYREWPHVIICGLSPGGAHPCIVYKPKPNPYNPGRGRKHRDNKKVNYFSRSKCFWDFS